METQLEAIGTRGMLGSSLEGWGLGAGTHTGPWGQDPQSAGTRSIWT